MDRIQKGYNAYQKGELNAARDWLDGVNSPQAFHVLGLVERRSGRLEAAAIALAEAARQDPHNHEIANNQGRVALDANDAQQAETFFQTALALRPGWLPAIEGLARSLNAQHRWQDALRFWHHLTAQKPDSLPYQYGAAMANLETGAVEAAEQAYNRMLAEGASDPAIWFMRARARLELGDMQGGLSDLRLAWDRQPSEHVLRNLANTLWMMGDMDGFREVLDSAPQALGILVITLLRESENVPAALQAWHALPETMRTSLKGSVARALLAIALEDPDTARQWAERAVTHAPGDPGAADVAITTRLMQGESASALSLIRARRRADPYNQHWIAHEATALRLSDTPAYEALVQLDRHVRTYPLPVPPGYRDIETFNRALAETLDRIRGFRVHPLDQSLKLGAQTSRDLATLPDPIVQAYMQALDGPIRSYLRDIGNAPDHPLTARNSGQYRFNGCWSVKLKGGGRHVNHVHPQGWISSAYYVSVPQNMPQASDKAGWIKFAEPPFSTLPVLGPQKWIAPRAGYLVLFPSYLWHGTSPTPPGSERVTAPFDLLPA